MTREETLDTAKQMVCGHREQEYGSPEDNFKRIADYWTTYKNVEFNAEDVAMMMALLKIARIQSGNATKDSFIDLAGYAACGAEITFPEPATETQNVYAGGELVATIIEPNTDRKTCNTCDRWNLSPVDEICMQCNRYSNWTIRKESINHGC